MALQQEVPKFNIESLKKYWKNDLIAAVSVSLVALPLGLGVAIASGSPPMSGIWAAIVGGLITTLVRSGKISINGPGAGIIVVILNANEWLADADGTSFKYVLAAIICAGVVQMLLGVMKLGKIADAIPPAVIQGMLAAIGIIIMAKQVHVGFGVEAQSSSIVGTILEIPNSFKVQNPFVFFITLACLATMIIYPRLKSKALHFIPAAVWVLMISIPLVLFFNFLDPHTIDFLGEKFEVGPEYLIQIPNNVLDSIIFPDFSKIGEVTFWISVLSIVIISSIETLISIKAVDKLDPYKRQTSLNQDLTAVGLATVVSGAIGGLPVMTVIVRSSVNITNGAKTSWSNFFHAIILLLFVFAFTPIIQEIPLAALAAILIYTGYKLANPNQFRDAYLRGEDQMLIVFFTVIATIMTSLLWGILLGMAFKLSYQQLRSRMSVQDFIKAMVRPQVKTRDEDDFTHHQLSGVWNFFNVLRLKQLLRNSPGNYIKLYMGDSIIVDFTVMEYLREFAQKLKSDGKQVDILGLDNHIKMSGHPLATRILQIETSESTFWMTQRQKELRYLAKSNEWEFTKGRTWENPVLGELNFFKSHLVEYSINHVSGHLPHSKRYFFVEDVKFDEGALEAKQVYNTTVLVQKLDCEIPEFTLEKEEFVDRVFSAVGFRSINLANQPAFNARYHLTAPDEEKAKEFFNEKQVEMLMANEIFHIESSGSRILYFKKLRLASLDEVKAMIAFAEEFEGLC